MAPRHRRPRARADRRIDARRRPTARSPCPGDAAHRGAAPHRFPAPTGRAARAAPRCSKPSSDRPVQPLRLRRQARIAAHRGFAAARQHFPSHVLQGHPGLVGAQAREVLIAARVGVGTEALRRPGRQAAMAARCGSDIDRDRALYIGPCIKPAERIAGAQLELADAVDAALRDRSDHLDRPRFPRPQRCSSRRRPGSEPRCRADRRSSHCAARTRSIASRPAKASTSVVASTDNRSKLRLQ